MCKLNSAPGVRPGENQDLLTFDFQTLVTHNRTIICGSLREGLTYSSCAQHAEADCHKNDCVGRGVQEKSESLHSFTFLVTVRVRFFPIDFNFSPLIYSKIVFCKSCDRSNLLNLKHQNASKCLSTGTTFPPSPFTHLHPSTRPKRIKACHPSPQRPSMRSFSAFGDIRFFRQTWHLHMSWETNSGTSEFTQNILWS